MISSIEERRQLICEECDNFESCSSNMFYFGNGTISPRSWFVDEAIDIMNEKETTGETRGLGNITAKGYETLKIIKNETAKKNKG